MTQNQNLAVALACVNVPQGSTLGLDSLRLGIQSGSTVLEDVECTGQPVVFRFSVPVTGGEGNLFLRGPFVHGPRAASFFYLCWGWRVAGHWQPNSRIKIQLGSIPAALLARLLRENRPLRARIDVAPYGQKPTAASLKPDRITWGAE